MALFWIVLTVIILLLYLLRKLFMAPVNHGSVVQHRFTPKYYAANRVESLCVRVLGRSLLHGVSASKLVEEALASVPQNVGFGKSDHWRKPFEMLANVANKSSTLSVEGRERLRDYLLHSLRVRLQMEYFVSKNGGKLSAVDLDDKMVFVVGLPRSGATLVHNLLSFDADSVSFTYSDVVSPVSPSKPEEIKKRIDSLKKSMPMLNRKHVLSQEKKEDDTFLLQQLFVHPLFALACRNCDEYREWLFNKDTDLTPFYQDLKTLYKIMILRKGVQHYCRVFAKSPFHATFMRSLLNVFPNARFVVLHRSPKIALSSFCSVLQTIASHFEHSSDLKALGKEASNPRLLQQYLEARGKGAALVVDKNFVDIPFKWLMVDATVAIKEIYTRFDWKYEHLEERKVYMKQNPPELFGKHVYSVDTFSLDPIAINASWARYLEANPDLERAKPL